MRGPLLRGLVIIGAFKGRLKPEIDLHDIDIAFQPVRDLVLRDVVGKRTRKRQIAQMIDRRLVVQFQAAIAQPPIVADALFPVDDERIEADPLELDRRRNPGMAAADNQHIRLAAAERHFGPPLFGPVRAGEIAHRGGRCRLARSRVADFIKIGRGRHRPGLRRGPGRADQPERADARAIDRLKRDDGLNHLAACDNRPAGRQRRGVDPEVVGVNLGGALT
jgi:hypothetical protein